MIPHGNLRQPTGPAPSGPRADAALRRGMEQGAGDHQTVDQRAAAAAGPVMHGLALADARRLLQLGYPEAWDALETCCDGDPDARCRPGIVAAFAELNDEPAGTVDARLRRARIRLHAWMDPRRPRVEAATHGQGDS